MVEFKIYTHRQRPELAELLSTFGDVWPEFIFHDEIARAYLHHTDTSKYVLQAMKSAARQANMVRMIAPVRPTLKSQYSLTPIERFITWKQADGSPFDPWLRMHWKEGGEIIKTAPHSMIIRGKVEEWESWTKMRFPESGSYVVPGALQPISIDCERDEGIYMEPNVWVRHNLQAEGVERL